MLINVGYIFFLSGWTVIDIFDLFNIFPIVLGIISLVQPLPAIIDFIKLSLRKVFYVETFISLMCPAKCSLSKW